MVLDSIRSGLGDVKTTIQAGAHQMTDLNEQQKSQASFLADIFTRIRRISYFVVPCVVGIMPARLLYDIYGDNWIFYLYTILYIIFVLFKFRDLGRQNI